MLGGYFSLLEFCVMSNLCKVYMDFSTSTYALAALDRLAPLIMIIVQQANFQCNYLGTLFFVKYAAVATKRDRAPAS